MKQDGTLLETPHTCIPFRKTLAAGHADGHETLIPTELGPPAPTPGQNPKRGEKKSDHSGGNKVSLNKLCETIPSYFVTHDYVINLKNSLSTETEEKVTAEVLGNTSRGKERRTLSKVLIDSGAIHYNYISTSCVNVNNLKKLL